MTSKKLVFWGLGAFALIFAQSCTKEYAGIEELDKQTVQEYIQKNNLNLSQYKQTGIYYQVLRAGNGPSLAYNQNQPIVFTVKTLDGKFAALDTFTQKSYDFFGYFRPDSLREVIKFAAQKQGSIIRVILPSRFAYGKSGSGAIPGNASLDYTITALTTDQMDAYDDQALVKYMAAQNLTGFTKTAGGVYYKITEVGDGTAVISDDSSISVQYTGKLLNGTVFDQTTTGTTATFMLGSLIKGWRETLPLIRKNGQIRILVPSAKAYGFSAQSSNIPPFSCLDFDIKVTDVAN